MTVTFGDQSKQHMRQDLFLGSSNGRPIGRSALSYRVKIALTRASDRSDLGLQDACCQVHRIGCLRYLQVGRVPSVPLYSMRGCFFFSEGRLKICSQV